MTRILQRRLDRLEQHVHITAATTTKRALLASPHAWAALGMLYSKGVDTVWYACWIVEAGRYDEVRTLLVELAAQAATVGHWPTPTSRQLDWAVQFLNVIRPELAREPWWPHAEDRAQRRARAYAAQRAMGRSVLVGLDSEQLAAARQVFAAGDVDVYAGEKTWILSITSSPHDLAVDSLAVAVRLAILEYCVQTARPFPTTVEECRALVELWCDDLLETEILV